MIVSEKYKYVYMMLPKTASTSMSNILTKKFDGKLWWNEWSEEAKSMGFRQEHLTHLPAQYSDYFIFTTVRNPYEHQISEYKFFYSLKGKFSMYKSFNDYIENQKLWSYFDQLHQTDDYVPPKGYVKYKINNFLKLERLEEDFNKLPFVRNPTKLPKINVQKRRNNDCSYTPKTASIVLKQRALDFETFNYDVCCENYIKMMI